jgi:hypothetical protein
MVAVGSVHAQDNSSSDYSDKSGFRLQGGVGISTLYFKNQDDNYDNLKTKIKVGGFAGVGYEKRFGKVFALQPELNYVNKGSKREFTDPPNGGQMSKVKLNMHMLEVPVLAKFYIGDNFNIYVGPAFSFLLGAKNKSTFFNPAGEKIGDDQSVNIMKDKYADADGNHYFNRFDVGLNAGLEFVTNKGFFVGGRIDQGFMDLTNDDYKGYVGTDAIIFPGDDKWVGNTGVQVMAGFRF